MKSPQSSSLDYALPKIACTVEHRLMHSMDDFELASVVWISEFRSQSLDFKVWIEKHSGIFSSTSDRPPISQFDSIELRVSINDKTS